MATIRAISIRLKSIKNIQKITKSMKMVSAAKYARAERELKNARPLGDNTRTFYDQIEAEKAEGEADKSKKVLYVAVTSDRGLCGAVHTSVGRHIRNALSKEGEKNLEDTRIVCVGDKARSILQRKFGGQFLFVCNEYGRLPPTFMDACRVTNEILKSEFPFDTGRIVFNKFRSVVSYATSEIKMLSLERVMNSDKLRAYDDASEETMLSIMEFSMAGLLYYAMKEGAASEQSSRMTAMDNASKNAGEMIDQLTLKFNRTRQAVITKELIEIISGAAALKH